MAPGTGGGGGSGVSTEGGHPLGRMRSALLGAMRLGETLLHKLVPAVPLDTIQREMQASGSWVRPWAGRQQQQLLVRRLNSPAAFITFWSLMP